MSLQRKRVTVRTKKGKVYQRSMLVKSSGSKLNRSGKLNALNPWEQRHMEHVSTNSALGERARAYGSSGPGSTHSLLAYMAGAQRQIEKARWERAKNIEERDHRSAFVRRQAGQEALSRAALLQSNYRHRPEIANTFALTSAYHYTTEHSRDMLAANHGEHNIYEVHQDPRKWVR